MCYFNDWHGTCYNYWHQQNVNINIIIINNNIIMKNIIIIASSIIIASLSLNAKEVSSNSNENSDNETVSSLVMTEVMEELNNSVSEALENEARTSIELHTEYSMKFLSEAQNINDSKSNGYYAYAAPVTIVTLAR